MIPRFVWKRMVVCAHKVYDDETGERMAKLRERFEGFTVVGTSIIDDNTLAQLSKALFDALGVIRVYTKQVGKDVELVDPVILPIGGDGGSGGNGDPQGFRAETEIRQGMGRRQTRWPAGERGFRTGRPRCD